MRKILIVSCQPFSFTNRSIDTMTQFFMDKKDNITHLVYGLSKIKRSGIINSLLNNENFIQLYSDRSYLSYLGFMGKIFPDFLLKLIIKSTNKTIKFINFREYDLIILETGKPLFLLDIIPVDIPLIVRQSDPLEISIGSSRTLFRQMENRAICQSKLFLVAHEKAVEEYKFSNNIRIWKSGFEIKRIEHKKNIEKSLFYMGLYKIDKELIKKIAKRYNDYIIHIVGNYKDTLNLPNVIFHGYLSYDEYMHLLLKSKCYIMPYKNSEVKKMNKTGLTSKYYLAMSLGKPILSRTYGSIQNDKKEFNLFAYSTHKEALDKLEYILNNNFFKTIKSSNFLENLSITSRKQELDFFLQETNIL